MLKQVRKKHIWIFTGVLLLVLIACLQVVYKKQNANLTIEEKVYSNQEEYNEIEIIYPQLQGMKDEDKEYRINRLIENDIKKILKKNSLFDENNLFLHLDYEVKFLNNNIISIVYKGSEGAVHNVQTRSYAILVATTIDMENEEIITLNDFIIDFDALSLLLLEDKFESITAWDGIKGGYKISEYYEGDKRELLLEHLLTAADFDISNHYIEWYTDGDNLIIVDLESGYYYEYLMDFDSLADVVDRSQNRNRNTHRRLSGLFHEKYPEILNWVLSPTVDKVEIGISAGASSTSNSQYLLKKDVSGYEVILYDKENNEVYKMVYPIEPWIKEVTDNILEIGVSTGNPSTYVFYYNKDTAKMSDTYFNSILFGDKYIAYMESAEKIILSDIFDEGILYKEVEGNFTKCLNPIINIEVLDNDNILLEYYAGGNFEKKSELISISDRQIKNEVENSETANEDLLRSMDYEYIDYESIEKDHEILEYNICTSPNYDYNNTILSECLRKDIEYDNEMCSEMSIVSPLETEFFLFDFNADNLEDYLVCMHGYLWGGSGGNTVRIYIQEKEGTLKKVLDITMRLHEPGLPNEHAPMAVLNEITDGYYAIVLPWSNLIMRYEKDEETYCF